MTRLQRLRVRIWDWLGLTEFQRQLARSQGEKMLFAERARAAERRAQDVTERLEEREQELAEKRASISELVRERYRVVFDDSNVAPLRVTGIGVENAASRERLMGMALRDLARQLGWE